MNYHTTKPASAAGILRGPPLVHSWGVLCSVMLFSLFWMACEPLDTRRVSLAVAPLPTQWREIFGDSLRYRLYWYDAQANRHTRMVDNLANLPVITVDRLSQTPVYLVPISPRGEELSPAGAVYPLALDHNGKLQLSWSTGCPVRLLYSLFQTMHGLYRFNVSRYLAEVQKRSEGRECWIDEARVAARILIRSMRADAIRLLPRYSHVVDLPAGRWLSADLALPLAMEHDGGAYTLAELPVGVYHFYETNQRLQATVHIEVRRALLLVTQYAHP